MGRLPYPGVAGLRDAGTCQLPYVDPRCKETHMLWTIFVILLVLWLLGLVTSYTPARWTHLFV